MRKLAILVTALAFAPAAFAAGGGGTASWQQWHAGNELGDRASLQRGARNFINYCAGCHSLKYVRYQRIGTDLAISDEVLKENLLLPGAKITDYVLTSMPEALANEWFGIVPPDLSLITRSKGSDYVFQFLKTFYVDPNAATGTNNLALAGTAMPHVLSDLQGLQRAVFDEHGAFVGFEAAGAPGQLSPAAYDAFVRDTVNFLEYAGEPAKLHRATIGVWVVLFLLLFTALAWLLKQEYWKDVH
ncbi:MAG TPA: cytochrome c1 [Steroidobacteraceae bacterium]|jgi:ubiquinol-cytochrome c reductase cytochrome c1 subunit|nr:cytochrome c1 [Steroidobacteraceae bacterium]